MPSAKDKMIQSQAELIASQRDLIEALQIDLASQTLEIKSDLAKDVLGETYGGPSISFEDGKFVVYRWYDAPVSEEIIGQGDTIQAALQQAKAKLESGDA